jgi:autonomous glycyl radical cofactor GrcA
MDPVHIKNVYPQDLVRHVATSTGLDDATATRVVADVVAYFGQTVEEFVRQRHAQLKDLNKRNDDIWPRLAGEVSGRRFKVNDLTERQLRRIIYR